MLSPFLGLVIVVVNFPIVARGSKSWMQMMLEYRIGYRILADTLQKAYSVAKIEHPEVMDENGKQKVGGLMDPRMGSEYTLPCVILSVDACQPSTEISNVRLVKKEWPNVQVISVTLSSLVQSFTVVSS